MSITACARNGPMGPRYLVVLEPAESVAHINAPWALLRPVTPKGPGGFGRQERHERIAGRRSWRTHVSARPAMTALHHLVIRGSPLSLWRGTDNRLILPKINHLHLVCQVSRRLGPAVTCMDVGLSQQQ